MESSGSCIAIQYSPKRRRRRRRRRRTKQAERIVPFKWWRNKRGYER